MLKIIVILLLLIPSSGWSLSKKEGEHLFKEAKKEEDAAGRVNGFEHFLSCNPDIIKQMPLSDHIKLIDKALASFRTAKGKYQTIENDAELKASSGARKLIFNSSTRSEKCDEYILNQEKLLLFYRNLLFDQKLQEAEVKEQAALQNPYDLEKTSIQLSQAADLYKESAGIGEKLMADSGKLISENQKSLIKEKIQVLKESGEKCTKNADLWQKNIKEHKSKLRERIAAFKAKGDQLQENGCYADALEMYGMASELLTEVSQSKLFDVNKELQDTKDIIHVLEKQSRESQHHNQSLSKEEWNQREHSRRDQFYSTAELINPAAFIQASLYPQGYPSVVCLDGKTLSDPLEYFFFTEQYYRFLVKTALPMTHFFVKVYQNGEVIHQERVLIPSDRTFEWEQYLTTDGLLYVPGTRLKSDFGLDLRIQIVPCIKAPYAIIISQKGKSTPYRFSISLDEKKDLYAWRYALPPPWQLMSLTKPSLSSSDKPINKSEQSPKILNLKSQLEKSISQPTVNYPILDTLVEKMKRDPLLLAQYVYNEIAFVEPFLYEEDGAYIAPGIRSNPSMTFLEKQGSPWEQCQLLVYLLQKAGYEAVYLEAGTCAIPKAIGEKLLLIQHKGAEDILVKYPGVLFYNGDQWISLFPWLKEMHVEEGYNLYTQLPDEYASAERWINHYLKNDPAILKHLGSDQNDTAGVLFVRFVQEELKKKGLSLQDVGIHRTQLKKQFTSWSEFPRPKTTGELKVHRSIENRGMIAKVGINVFSPSNIHNKITFNLETTQLNCTSFPLWFSQSGASDCFFHISDSASKLYSLKLDPNDTKILIVVQYYLPIGREKFYRERSFNVMKGTNAAICLNFGSESPKIASTFYKQLIDEQNKTKELHAFLAYMGAKYFENCNRADRQLSQLHKVLPYFVFGCGLSEITPDVSKKSGEGGLDLRYPSVDMQTDGVTRRLNSACTPTIWHEEITTAENQRDALVIVDISSNEHQILRDFFNDKNAISTVKILQLQHQEHQNNGLFGPGFLAFSPSSFAASNELPVLAQKLYYSNLKNVHLDAVKKSSLILWQGIGRLLTDSLGNYTRAYITAHPYRELGGPRQHVGSLIFNPNEYGALISNDDVVKNGGFGSRLPIEFKIDRVKEWPLGQDPNYFRQRHPSLPGSLPLVVDTIKVKPDVRQEHKQLIDLVADPVDVITGAFYIDEVDLVLPGPFPLAIRRNYNSQNPLQGSLGYGWKLSLNPFLVEEDGKLYAAEEDGTMIAYRHNKQSDRWEVFAEDNPDLCNLKQDPLNNTANPFNAYIKNDILYRDNGSRSFFQNGLLQKIINATGNTLIFTYSPKKRLKRIESAYGAFFEFNYTPDGLINEIYSQDGRHITYDYNLQGDLWKITLPNGANIVYEYDSQHRIERETKPYGMVLENTYENGKVKEQRTPMGPAQQMATTATFDYQKGLSTVTDGEGGKTTYFIRENRIYKVIDPEGYSIFHAWFVDDKSWFDPETEKIVSWDQPGGYQKSLKSTTDKRGLITSYFYDGKGNPKEVEISGVDLTGDFQTHSSRTFQFNEKNLCEHSLHLDRETKITYDERFPYLPKTIEKYVQNNLVSYNSITYDALGQLFREDHSGSIIEWDYDSKCGLPSKKTEITNTDDPPVVTTYAYNRQGQCIEMITADAIQKNDYDILGNRYKSEVYTKDGHLLSATYSPYDLNNRPRWIQGASPNQTLRLEYLPSGEIKAKIQELDALGHAAYTLYDYDTRGFLIEEIDPRGYCTKHEYDGIGRVKVKTVENFSIHYTYEPGDLIASMTTPAGFITTYDYTANGLLKKQTNPDGTKSTFVYDLLARPKILTKNGQAQHIIYDDIHRKIIRKGLTSETTEEFDTWGNCIRFTDAAGYIWEKTYDALGRIKTQTNPNGEQTLWSYQGDTVICTTVSGEKMITRYAAGEVISTQCFDVDGILIASSEVTIDPVNQTQTVKAGDILTTTQTNALGLVKRIQTGTNQISYEYDHSANCTTITDGEKRITTQEFDALNRLAKKTLPDRSILTYIYDSDSNLCETHLPNGAVWKATHDEMGRKHTEELYAAGQTKERWEYTYENGLLATAKDPMNRIHTYEYDDFERLKEESVDGWKRKYTYDPRGLVETIEQWKMLPDGYATEYSRIERSYDESGRLASELAYLNNQLLSQTTQHWAPSKRTLDIGSHTREFFYQGGRLKRVLATPVDLHYTYCLDGSLQQKITPVNATTWHYNSSALPEKISTNYTSSSIEQSMTWDLSGKLRSLTSNDQLQTYRYNPQGYLASVNEDTYTHDFGGRGIGVLTETPLWNVPDDGIDPFGKTIAELRSEKLIPTHYDEMGQVKACLNQTLEWNPWGQLVKVTGPSYVWEATYDACGRRLQTRYTPSWGSTLTTTSIYDPEEEFQEIGLSLNGKTFWKIYGPETCDAVVDDTEVIYLSYNALKHLSELITSKEIVEIPSTLFPYGPFKGSPFIKPELYRLASSLTWHSKAPDLTGFIWMGARYYDPSSCKFLSPDPIGYPINMNLYAYANGDPINFFDPDGRLTSSLYRYGQYVVSTSIDVWGNPRFQGGLQFVGGVAEAFGGAALTSATGGLGGFAGGAFLMHGADQASTGLTVLFTGRYHDTVTSKTMQLVGLSSQAANFVEGILCMGRRPASGVQRAQIVSSDVNVASTLKPQYTRSNLQRGQEIHKSYKIGSPGLKEYRLPSGKKIDFVDTMNGIIYELKPHNPRSMRAGYRQLELYRNELKVVPGYDKTDWKIILETY